MFSSSGFTAPRISDSRLRHPRRGEWSPDGVPYPNLSRLARLKSDVEETRVTKGDSLLRTVVKAKLQFVVTHPHAGLYNIAKLEPARLSPVDHAPHRCFADQDPPSGDLEYGQEVFVDNDVNNRITICIIR